MDVFLSLDQPIDAPPIMEHQPIEFACAAAAGTWLALTLNGQVLDPFLRPGDPTWRWRWNPGPAVGLHQLRLTATLPDGTAQQQQSTLRVVPRKLDQERYEALLDDIQRAAYNIAYALSGASMEGAALEREAPWQRSRIEEYYALFEQRLDAFARAVRRIAAHPREQLRGSAGEAPLGQAAQLDGSGLARLMRGTFDKAPAGVATELQTALRPEGGLLPHSVPTTHSDPSFDIYEHRLLKHLLTLLLQRARGLGALAGREVERLTRNAALLGTTGARLNRAQQIADGCTHAIRLLRELRGFPFLSDVRPLESFHGATPLLQRDAAYREVYRMWQALRQYPYLAFDSPLFSLPISDLPRLYEVWCALKLVDTLLALGGEVRAQHLVTSRHVDDDDLALIVNLTEHTPLLVLGRGEATLTLRYQPRYRPIPSAASQRLGSLDRHVRVPDLAIEITCADHPPRVLVFDAKYRLDADGQGVPQDALADAYAYLGAIGIGRTRAAIGAFLLYPGLGAAEVYPSGVGAVPLVPGQPDTLADVIVAFLAMDGADEEA